MADGTEADIVGHVMGKDAIGDHPGRPVGKSGPVPPATTRFRRWRSNKFQTKSRRKMHVPFGCSHGACGAAIEHCACALCSPIMRKLRHCTGGVDGRSRLAQEHNEQACGRVLDRRLGLARSWHSSSAIIQVRTANRPGARLLFCNRRSCTCARWRAAAFYASYWPDPTESPDGTTTCLS